MHRALLPLIGLFVVFSAAPAVAQERDDGDWWLGSGWQRVHFDGVVFKGSAHRRDDETLDESDLQEVLGGIMLDDLRPGTPAGRRGERRPGSIAGRWLEPGARGARVLQLRIGVRPLAELTDLDADGEVDVVLWSED